MDGLAARAGLGKGTVFRRFRSRAGIFQALLDDDERGFQEQVLCGLPPLGPGAEPVERLIAYGRDRIAFLLDRHLIARAALDRTQPAPAGESSLSRMHIRMLLGQARLRVVDLDSLALQLMAALEGPVLLYLAMVEQESSAGLAKRLADSWQVLVEGLVLTDGPDGLSKACPEDTGVTFERPRHGSDA